MVVQKIGNVFELRRNQWKGNRAVISDYPNLKDEVKKLSLRLTPYKRPINIVVSKDPLPRTTTRKVKRKEVKELVNV